MTESFMEIEKEEIEKEEQINYGKKKVRIGADIPRELKTRLNEAIIPGMLSAIIRELLEGYLALNKIEGAGITMKAVLKKDLGVHINRPLYQEGDTT